MKNIFNIVKKELDKIFRFPRMIFSTLLLPGLLIFVIYSVMGMNIESQIKKEEEQRNNYFSKVQVINRPDSFEQALSKTYVNNFSFSDATINNLDTMKDQLKNGEIDVIIIFEQDFDDKVSSTTFPSIEIIFNQYSNNSNNAYQKVLNVVEVLKNDFLELLNINPNIINVTAAPIEIENKNPALEMLAMLLPLLIVIFIFASAMSIGSDAIAGEKERGTIATLLMAPMRREQIIIGKMISTTIITIAAALSSFIGIMASLPFAKSMFAVDGTISYGILSYFGILGILLLLALLASSILLVTSTIAKTVKEATMYAMPIYIIAILIPSMSLGNTSIDNVSSLFIPIYNCTLGLKAIFSMTITLEHYLIIVFSTLIYISLLIYVLIKLFKNESVLYSK